MSLVRASVRAGADPRAGGGENPTITLTGRPRTLSEHQPKLTRMRVGGLAVDTPARCWRDARMMIVRRAPPAGYSADSGRVVGLPRPLAADTIAGMFCFSGSDRARRRSPRGHLLVGLLAATMLLGSATLVAGCGGGGGRVIDAGDLVTFDVCVDHTQFLMTVRHGQGMGLVAIIRDRARHAVVGEISNRHPLVMLGGAAAAQGRYVMSTATPTGRDAGAIERCWDRISPVSP
jgi:hypothetical protein